MKVYELQVEWDNLTTERKKLAVDNIFAALKSGIDEEEDDVLKDILILVDSYDEEDYFGTEGLDV